MHSQNDERWEDGSEEWLGKASMAQRHKFMLVRSPVWYLFNAISIGIAGDLSAKYPHASLEGENCLRIVLFALLASFLGIPRVTGCSVRLRRGYQHTGTSTRCGKTVHGGGWLVREHGLIRSRVPICISAVPARAYG